jgi:subtilisin-like proprotein convertase family protein
MKTKYTLFFLIPLLLLFSPVTGTFSQTCYSPVIDSIISRISVQDIRTVVRELSGDTTCVIGGITRTLLTRAYNQPENALAAQYIYEKFQSYGLNPVYWQFSSTGANVIGKKTGNRYPNQYYIIGAHFDSYPWGPYAPGADDDASGIAGVLEAAKQLSTYNTDYTILFIAWDEEERGLFGSHAYVDTAYFRGDSIMGVINLDMIAYDPYNQNNISIITNPASLQLAEMMYSCTNIYLPVMNPFINISTSSSSDHASFWGRGYQAIWPFEEPYNPYVNSTADSIELFNFEYFKRFTQAAVAGIAVLGFDYLITFLHQNVPSSSDTTDRVASVTIRSGKTIAQGNNSPKLYYKIGSGTFYSQDYFYHNLDTFKYHIPGQPRGTTVSYYFAAQDSSGLLMATLPPGGSGINPPGTVPPPNLFTYYITSTFTQGSNTVPKNLPPGQIIFDSIFVIPDYIVFGVDVNLTITHPNDQDLMIGLINPEGNLVKLSYGNGGSGANYVNTTFDDDAAVSIKNGAPPYTGSYRPEDPLSVFNNHSMHGIWKLRIYNNSTTLTGQLVSWSLSINYFNPIGITANNIPVITGLSQNYPNPFNPATKISFSLEKQYDVKLAVYDMIGREVSILVNDRMNPGQYNFNFNSGVLSSGVYFYTLYLNGSRFDTKKMVLIK